MRFSLTKAFMNRQFSVGGGGMKGRGRACDKQRFELLSEYWASTFSVSICKNLRTYDTRPRLPTRVKKSTC